MTANNASSYARFRRNDAIRDSVRAELGIKPKPAPEVGTYMSLPDGPGGTIVAVEAGREYGHPVWYVTVINGLGERVTRWVPA